MTKLRVLSARFLYSIKVDETIINLDNNLNSVIKDATSDAIDDIAKIDIILNWLALYST